MLLREQINARKTLQDAPQKTLLPNRKFAVSDPTLSQPQPKKTPNLQALTNPNPNQPLPIQPTPLKLQLSCKPLFANNQQ